MPKIQKECEYCGIIFCVYLSASKRRKNCSHLCQYLSGHSKESNEKNRQSHLGKKFSEEGKKNHKAACVKAGKEGKLARYSKENLPPNLKIAQSKSPIQKGSKHLYWNPNKQDTYGYEFTPKLKKKILERDNNECRNCKSSKRLVVHHLDEDKLNNAEENLIVLCRHCHMKVHHKTLILQLAI